MEEKLEERCRRYSGFSSRFSRTIGIHADKKLCRARVYSPRCMKEILAVRFGAAVMPIGFLVAGLWHPESDPGVAIWLVPAGALPLIFGLISIALSSRVTE